MENQHQLKQRIVGAIVLVALAVIFIPMILTGEREPQLASPEDNVPAEPAHIAKIKEIEIEAVPSPQPQERLHIPVDERSQKITQPLITPDTVQKENDKAKPAEIATPQPVAKVVAPKRAWAVQVGSFSKQTNAFKLRDKLRKQGYKAFVEATASAGGLNYRVRVGPVVEQKEAKALQTQLREKQKVKGLVVAHP